MSDSFPLLYPYTFHQMNGSARRQGSARRRAARALAAGGSRYGPEAGAGVPPMRTQTPGHQPQTGSLLAPPQPQLQPQLQPQPQAALPQMRPMLADAMGLARATSKSLNTGRYRLRKDRLGTAGIGRERPGTPCASPKHAGGAPPPNAANPSRRARARRRSCTRPSRPRALRRSRRWDTTARHLIKKSVLLCEVLVVAPVFFFFSFCFCCFYSGLL